MTTNQRTITDLAFGPPRIATTEVVAVPLLDIPWRDERRDRRHVTSARDVMDAAGLTHPTDLHRWVVRGILAPTMGRRRHRRHRDWNDGDAADARIARRLLALGLDSASTAAVLAAWRKAGRPTATVGAVDGEPQVWRDPDGVRGELATGAVVIATRADAP